MKSILLLTLVLLSGCSTTSSYMEPYNPYAIGRNIGARMASSIYGYHGDMELRDPRLPNPNSYDQSRPIDQFGNYTDVASSQVPTGTPGPYGLSQAAIVGVNLYNVATNITSQNIQTELVNIIGHP